VAAVESETARETAEVAARLARELKAPLTFIHVRPCPTAIASSVRSERQSIRALFRAHSALDVALPVATQLGVAAQGEIVDGNPVDELVKVAIRRKARLLVVGSRRRRLKRSVSRGVLQTSAVPVVIAHARRLTDCLGRCGGHGHHSTLA
jgi:nucleotide-binding universal stress UspA family protein